MRTVYPTERDHRPGRRTVPQQKEADKIRKHIAGHEGKLANEAFVAKAPADVVAGIRETLAGLKNQLASVEEIIRDLVGECYIPYAGSDHQLLVEGTPDWAALGLQEADWPIHAPRLMILAIESRQMAVRAHFHEDSVIRVGSYEGCGWDSTC